MSRNHKFLILVLIAVVLGYAIYNQQRTKTSLTTPPSTSTPLTLLSSLTEDERFILNPPFSTASAELKKKHADAVAKLAKEGTSLEIKDCKPNILILQVKQGEQLKINNHDGTNHRIIFDSEHIYELPANASKTIKADFKYGTGDYGYVCEGVGLTGFLHIVP